MGALGAFTAMSAMTSLSGAYASSQATRSAGDYRASIAETNAKIANLEADQTIAAGDAMAAKRILVATQRSGSIKAAQGASGTDVNVGSNVLTRAGEEFAGRMDEITIRNNAARKAWGFKMQASQDAFDAEIESMTSKTKARNTLLTGGLSVLNDIVGAYASRDKKTGSGSTNQPFDTSTGSEWQGKV